MKQKIWTRKKSSGICCEMHNVVSLGFGNGFGDKLFFFFKKSFGDKLVANKI